MQRRQHRGAADIRQLDGIEPGKKVEEQKGPCHEGPYVILD